MSRPSNTMEPLLAGSVPASTAMKVDLPAPFGPIRPVILPRGTSSDTPSTARMPSKWRCTSRAMSIGLSGGADTFVLRSGEVLRVDVPRLRPHPLRTEPQEAEDEQADDDPLEGGDKVRRPDVHDAQLARDFLQAERNGQRAEDRAHVVAAPADDDRGEQDDRLGVEPGRGRPDVEEPDDDSAGQPSDRAADDEDGHLQRDRVLAHRRGRKLLLTHCPQRPAARRIHDAPAHEPDERDAYG